jgi:hypothetical protein
VSRPLCVVRHLVKKASNNSFGVCSPVICVKQDKTSKDITVGDGMAVICVWQTIYYRHIDAQRYGARSTTRRNNKEHKKTGSGLGLGVGVASLTTRPTRTTWFHFSPRSLYEHNGCIRVA